VQDCARGRISDGSAVQSTSVAEAGASLTDKDMMAEQLPSLE
jgi:hypothetical protein